MVPLRISLPDLETTALSFPQEVRADPNLRMLYLAMSIIRHFLGERWCKENIYQEAESSLPEGFLRWDYRPGLEGDRKRSRVIDFAETLFNLQHVEGFDDRIDQMRAGQIEATFAEFDFARFLYIHDKKFKFVKPSGAVAKLAPTQSAVSKAPTSAPRPLGMRSTRRAAITCRGTSRASSS
jgi:hypothetical protein